MKAADVMTRRVWTVAPETTVADAARLMIEHRISGLPVVGPDQRLVGIVTEGDFLRRVELGTERRHSGWLGFLLGPGRLADEYVQAHARRVDEVMTTDVETATEDAELADLVRLMERWRIKRVPVVRDGRLVGIVSRANLLQALAVVPPAALAMSMDDVAIRDRVVAEIERQPWGPIASITVLVKDGVVSLDGAIFDERQRLALKVAAENIPGVRAVHDNLVWVEPTSGYSIEPPAASAPPRRWGRWAGALLAIGVAAVAGVYWFDQGGDGELAGLAYGNGRLEADEIDIATKFAGRIATLLVDEGDRVQMGQLVARMDVRDLEADLAKAEAQAKQAQQALAAARAAIDQNVSQKRLADQELQRARFLFQRGYGPQEVVDQRQSQSDTLAAAIVAARAQAAAAEHAVAAALQDVQRDRVDIADNMLVAPRAGTIQYRLANDGEVLPAGGKVFTLLDTGSAYMDVFLPTADAGRIAVGAEGRILLDALADRPILAHVSFVADEAQFTPKAVETRAERDKLMFRVKVRADPDALRRIMGTARVGLPGVAYVRVDPAYPWPAWLAGAP